MPEILAQRYEIVKLIGRGGMADVYLAYDRILSREVAVKIMKADMSSDPIALERFNREAIASTRLSHPNIVDVYDVGDEDSRHFIVMEYIKGLTLKQLIRKRGPLPYKEAVWMVKQLAGALMEAHRNGIIHRDVKSQNVMIKADGTVKVADFGIALANGAMQITSKDAVLGSVHYLAPELVKGSQATMQSDIYSLGIVLYEMLIGDVPFTGDVAAQVALQHVKKELPSVKELNPEIPQSVENIILKATAKDLEVRYKNVALMLKDLNECLKEEHLNDPKFTITEKQSPKQDDVHIAKTSKYPKKKKIDKEKSIFIITIAIISALSLFALIFILFISGFIGNKTKYATVPDLEKLSIVEANDILEKNSLTLDYSQIERIMTEDIPSGLIVSQYPEKDSELEVGSKVRVVVSEGTYQIMISYLGRDIEEVKEELKDSLFNIRVVGVESNEEPGTILTQTGTEPEQKYNPNIVNPLTFEYSQYHSFVIPFNTKGRDVDSVVQEFVSGGFAVEKIPKQMDYFTEEEIAEYAHYTVVRVEPSEGAAYTQTDENKIYIYYYE